MVRNVVINPEMLDSVELDTLLYVITRASSRALDLSEAAESIPQWQRQMFRNQYVALENERRALKLFADNRKKAK